MAGDAQRTIERFWEIQDSGDYTRLVELFAADAVVEDPIWGTHRGPEEIRVFMTTMVKEMGERQIHFTLDEVFGDDHACWTRWTMHSPAGSRGGCGIYKVKDGQLTYYRDYMDPPLES